MTRDEAIRHLYTYSSTNGSGQTTQEQHEEAKRMAIDALKQPERKTGKWRRRLVDCGFNADWHCSRCGWKTSLEEHGYNYCPNCGADMREQP